MKIEELREKLQSKEGLAFCGHVIKMIPSSLGSNDLILDDEGRYIVRGVDEYAIDVGEKDGIIFGSFDVFDDDMPGDSEFSFLYDLNEDKLYRFNNTIMLSNVGFDIPVGVFGRRLMTFDLKSKKWIPKMDIPNMYYCRRSPDGVLYMLRPLSIKSVQSVKIIDKNFTFIEAPEKYQLKYLWGMFTAYMAYGVRDDEDLESWFGMRRPSKMTISAIRKFLDVDDCPYLQGRVRAFKDLLDLLTRYGVDCDEDITSLIYCLMTIFFRCFKDGVYLGFPNHIFNTFFSRIMDEYMECCNAKTFCLSDDLDLINQIFEPYLYWTDEKVSNLDIEDKGLFKYRRENSILYEVEGRIGRLCFDVSSKCCTPKYVKNISRGYICEDYLIRTMENIRGASESYSYMYADIAYNILSKRYVVTYRSSDKVTDELILGRISLLRIKSGLLDMNNEQDSIADCYVKHSVKGTVDIKSYNLKGKNEKTTNVYIGVANNIDNTKLAFQKCIISDGVERENIWNIKVDTNNDYSIGYDLLHRRHVIRSETISLEVLGALTRTFNIHNWTWVRDDANWDGEGRLI